MQIWLKPDSKLPGQGKEEPMGKHTVEVGELCMLLPREMAETMGHALEAGYTVRLRKVEKK